MAGISILIRILALLVMYKISDPKIMPLLPEEENQLDNRITPQSELLQGTADKLVPASA